MIRAAIDQSAASFVTRLTARGQAIGQAQAELRLRAARSDPARWRQAGLLWPLFGDR